MIAQTTVIRSASSMGFGSALLVLVVLAPAGLLQLTGSLAAGIACLVVALLAGVVIFTLMTAHKLSYGPGGVYVVGDDGAQTLAWDSIEKFDLDKWMIEFDNYSRHRTARVHGMVIRLKSGPDIRVDWINTKRTIRRLNQALARFGGRESVPEISARPPAEWPRFTALGVWGVFNLVILRLMAYWPFLLLVGIMVNVLVVCVYMGVRMSKGR